jgi:hypothetical protein
MNQLIKIFITEAPYLLGLRSPKIEMMRRTALKTKIQILHKLKVVSTIKVQKTGRLTIRRQEGRARHSLMTLKMRPATVLTT